MRDRLIAFAGTFFPELLRRARLRARWAQPGEANAWCASWYFDLLREQLSAAAVVDDKTWTDLEFPRFFAAIDTTVSLVGRQYLFAQLRVYEYDPSLRSVIAPAAFCNPISACANKSSLRCGHWKRTRRPSLPICCSDPSRKEFGTAGWCCRGHC